MIKVPVSVGELIDKITILEIKLERMKDKNKKDNVRHEYEILMSLVKEHKISYPNEQIALKKINERLWDIEDFMRRAEAEKKFGKEFIELTRDEYRSNDERARIKRKINDQVGSELVEEKEYVSY